MGQAARKFDTLTYAKQLEAAGTDPAQAEIHANTLGLIMNQELVQKGELIAVEQSLRQTLQQEVQRLETKLEYEIAALRTETQSECQKIRHEMQQTSNRLLYQLSAVMLALLSIFTGIVHFLGVH